MWPGLFFFFFFCVTHSVLIQTSLANTFLQVTGVQVWHFLILFPVFSVSFSVLTPLTPSMSQCVKLCDDQESTSTDISISLPAYLWMSLSFCHCNDTNTTKTSGRPHMWTNSPQVVKSVRGETWKVHLWCHVLTDGDSKSLALWWQCGVSVKSAAENSTTACWKG